MSLIFPALVAIHPVKVQSDAANPCVSNDNLFAVPWEVKDTADCYFTTR